MALVPSSEGDCGSASRRINQHCRHRNLLQRNRPSHYTISLLADSGSAYVGGAQVRITPTGGSLPWVPVTERGGVSLHLSRLALEGRGGSQRMFSALPRRPVPTPVRMGCKNRPTELIADFSVCGNIGRFGFTWPRNRHIVDMPSGRKSRGTAIWETWR